MEQSLQIDGVWSFYKAMSDGAERFLFVKCSRVYTFFSLELCFPLAPIFDKCCPVPNNTGHLLNKELYIRSVDQYCKLRGNFQQKSMRSII